VYEYVIVDHAARYSYYHHGGWRHRRWGRYGAYAYDNNGYAYGCYYTRKVQLQAPCLQSRSGLPLSEAAA
jgi:hypothetical protein